MAEHDFTSKPFDLWGKKTEDSPKWKGCSGGFNIGAEYKATFPAMVFGNLTAYCLRRFGSPNGPYDDYKDLASWVVTTPIDGILLGIRPNLSGFHFYVMVHQEIANKANREYFESKGVYNEKLCRPEYPAESMNMQVINTVLAAIGELRRFTYVRDVYFNCYGLESRANKRDIEQDVEYVDLLKNL